MLAIIAKVLAIAKCTNVAIERLFYNRRLKSRFANTEGLCSQGVSNFIGRGSLICVISFVLLGLVN